MALVALISLMFAVILCSFGTTAEAGIGLIFVGIGLLAAFSIRRDSRHDSR